MDEFPNHLGRRGAIPSNSPLWHLSVRIGLLGGDATNLRLFCRLYFIFTRSGIGRDWEYRSFISGEYYFI